jgi:uroporphyrinogen III methyltransferase/synthase
VQPTLGKVYLVGAGPGDPGLITVKGKRCLEEAQAVVYDRLMDPSLLRSAPESAQLVFVGKERGRQAITQDEINRFLVDRASKGQTVVRLKGGDPFVFGRGGEEALALAEHGIPFEVVPGITSPIAAAAYAGIPITHRGIATTFTVVSGSEDPSKPGSSVPWDVLAKNGGTLVVLMGLAALGSIVDTLGRNGMALDTPAALVNWGTWAKQTTVTGSLENIVEKGKKAGLKPPVVAIFGGVVELREKISWFDRRPLFGKRVLITRSRTQASRLVGLLEDLGAEPIELPAIHVEPLEDYTELDGALTRLPEFGWVIFASTNAVESVFHRLEMQGRDSRAFAGTRIGAIGPATSAALANQGLRADFVPTRSISETVVKELSSMDGSGTAVLLPSADIGRDALAQGLASMGAQVERITAYKTTPSQGMADKAHEAFESGIDAVTFTSSSTVRNLVAMLNGNKSLLQDLPLICIGPTTAATATELGLKIDLVAQEHTVEGLVGAVVEYFAAK